MIAETNEAGAVAVETINAIPSAVTVNTKIHGACDLESKRYALGNVLVTRAGDDNSKRLYATAMDGRIMAVANATGRINKPAVGVPGVVLKGSGKKVTAQEQGEFWINDKGHAAKPNEGRFPRCNEILPKSINTSDYYQLVIDPVKLMELYEAIRPKDHDCKPVTLLVPKSSGLPDVHGDEQRQWMILADVGGAGFGCLMVCEPAVCLEEAANSFMAKAGEYCNTFELPG